MKKLRVRVEEYLKKAEPMFENLDFSVPEGIDKKIAKHFKDMALDYYTDALHFYESKEYINALAALEYAEGWLDAGKTVGVFKK